ncbi:hypothetical protein STEG23_015998, partial [Scotinomys teguina]
LNVSPNHILPCHRPMQLYLSTNQSNTKSQCTERHPTADICGGFCHTVAKKTCKHEYGWLWGPEVPDPGVGITSGCESPHVDKSSSVFAVSGNDSSSGLMPIPVFQMPLNLSSPQHISFALAFACQSGSSLENKHVKEIASLLFMAQYLAQYTPLILAIWKQRQVYLCEFKVSQDYIMRPCLNNRNKVEYGGNSC